MSTPSHVQSDNSEDPIRSFLMIKTKEMVLFKGFIKYVVRSIKCT